MRLIDADALAKFIDYGHIRQPSEKCFSENDIRDMIDMRPTICIRFSDSEVIQPCIESPCGAECIEVAPVRRGRWIEKKDFMYCSECAEGFDIINKLDFVFCPNCGARMEASDD